MGPNTLKIKPECDLIYLDKQANDESLFYNPITNFLKCKKYNTNYGINLSQWNSVLKDKNKSIQQYRSKKKNYLYLEILNLLIMLKTLKIKKI